MHTAYVNGRYLPHRKAMVHIEDRGYQFSDGIYEYIAFYNRRLLDGEGHLKRLERCLKEVSIALPMSIGAMNIIIRELIERNGREHGGLYLQVTRGVARRDHPFPKHTRPALVMTVCAPKFPKPYEIKDGVAVITAPDLRWARRDIKSVSLLANVLAKQEATAKKAREAWLVEDNAVSEGAVSNAYIISEKGELITHPADQGILGGITREVVLKLAREAQIPVLEKTFTLSNVRAAAEAFITSTSANVLPVVKVDDMVIGSGKPGPITKRLNELYLEHIEKETGYQWPQ
jgi:D-alanine transaminase